MKILLYFLSAIILIVSKVDSSFSTFFPFFNAYVGSDIKKFERETGIYSEGFLILPFSF